ncbi:hypothetical protein EOD39_14113 [Acipenser ruthenus]|uniref:Uncharacterized protein n=1 Tax=Acipenser ruthenus TaxID=7906 RepID=A0A662YMN7_ACIRT|nr:hypothetical protein EOD39_14113 [Acipenser ruthenus]
MPRLLSLFKKKGGAAGVKLQGIQEMLYGSNTVEKRRETVIRGLIIYLGENVEDLIKEYQDAEDANIQEDLTQHVLKIFVVNIGATDDDNPVAVGIAIEGAEVLSDQHPPAPQLSAAAAVAAAAAGSQAGQDPLQCRPGSPRCTASQSPALPYLRSLAN